MINLRWFHENNFYVNKYARLFWEFPGTLRIYSQRFEYFDEIYHSKAFSANHKYIAYEFSERTKNNNFPQEAEASRLANYFVRHCENLSSFIIIELNAVGNAVLGPIAASV